jgi:hypothetical protein
MKSEEFAAHEAYAPFEREGDAYLVTRRKELETAHGPLSTGVEALLAASARAHAASRFWHARGSHDADDDTSHVNAARLALDASKLELAALDLRHKERAVARPRAGFGPTGDHDDD